MKRLYLTVEGQTEAAFATTVLGPHLLNYGVYVIKPRFTGWNPRTRGRIPVGGMLNTFQHALRDMRIWLKEDQDPDARFSMMVDLYHLPHDVPGYEAAIKKPTGVLQATAIEKSISTELADDRFVPYLQVHEFEALVLADPTRLNSIYDVQDGKIKSLCRDCTRYDTPEEINSGQHSHPKYRIKQTVKEYDESVAGPLLAGEIGLETLREKCKHFGDWLTKLEQLDGSGVTH